MAENGAHDKLVTLLATVAGKPTYAEKQLHYALLGGGGQCEYCLKYYKKGHAL